jgi:hypothetical protein
VIDESDTAPPNPSGRLLILSLRSRGDPESDNALLQMAGGALFHRCRPIVEIHEGSMAAVAMAKSQPNRMGNCIGFKAVEGAGNGEAYLASSADWRRLKST